MSILAVWPSQDPCAMRFTDVVHSGGLNGSNQLVYGAVEGRRGGR
jgi:hypothetical protein